VSTRQQWGNLEKLGGRQRRRALSPTRFHPTSGNRSCSTPLKLNADAPVAPARLPTTVSRALPGGGATTRSTSTARSERRRVPVQIDVIKDDDKHRVWGGPTKIPFSTGKHRYGGGLGAAEAFTAAPAGIFTAVICAGNNSKAVEAVMATRPWWRLVKAEYCKVFDMKWVQSGHVTWDQLAAGQQLVSWFPGSSEVALKHKLLRNLCVHQHYQGKSAFDMLPLSVAVCGDASSSSFKAFQLLHVKLTRVAPGKPVTVKGVRAVDDSGDHLGPFDGRYCIPPTFARGGGEPVWILKPAMMSRGRGIHVVSSLQQLTDVLTGVQKETTSKLEWKANATEDGAEPSGYFVVRHDTTTASGVDTWIIQKYIERPLLINDRKFDIRMWVCITPSLHVYLFREGYVRTAAVPLSYGSDQDFANQYMHLCNNSIQKEGTSYGEHEDGNIASFETLRAAVAAQFPATPDFVEGQLLPRVKELITASAQSVAHLLTGGASVASFQLFGYDFMVDAELQTWLIEVNSAPSLAESSPLLEKLIPEMLEGLVTLCVDPVFVPKARSEFAAQHRARLAEPTRFEFVTCLLNAHVTTPKPVRSPRRGRLRPRGASAVERQCRDLAKLVKVADPRCPVCNPPPPAVEQSLPGAVEDTLEEQQVDPIAKIFEGS